ncbi:gliding motility protein GldM [soil metagenome]
MSIPKEPRQQMINMMYLVLTALLALNVSAEILNSFRLIDDGIKATNQSLVSKNSALMFEFEQKYDNNPVKTEPFLKEAQRVQLLSQDFYSYIENLKTNIITASGGIDEDGGLKGKKDVDVTTRILVEQKQGYELQKKINELRSQLLISGVLNEEDLKILDMQMPLTTVYDKTEAERLGKKDWVTYNFERVPVAATVALLSKLQGDIRNAETLILSELYKKVDVGVYKFDKLFATSLNENSYVLAGQQEFRTDIFVAATSSTQEVEVFVGEFKNLGDMYEGETKKLKTVVADFPLKDGFKKLEVVNGMASFKELSQTPGMNRRTGVVKLREPDGIGFRYLPFEFNYQSSKSTAVVSPEKMNVLYIGVPNPLAISVPGVPADKITARISKGNINGNNGRYLANVTATGDVNVDVYAEIDGQSKKMGEMTFRVKKIPKPIPTVLEVGSSRMQKSKFLTATIIKAKLDDFVFDVPFEVSEYDYMVGMGGDITINSTRVKGQAIPDDLKSYLKKLKPGQKVTVYFDNIKVNVAGEIVNVGTLIYELN